MTELKRPREHTEVTGGFTGPVLPASRSRLAVRAVAAVAVALLLGLIGWQMARVADGGAAGAPVGEGDAGQDQRVRLTVLLGGAFKIIVDGEVVVDRRLPPGERIEVAGRRRVEVQVPAAKSVRLEYNGERVQPQGRQDVPRTLVFIDDSEGG